MRSSPVVVPGILGHHDAQVPFAEDQHPVGHFGMMGVVVAISLLLGLITVVRDRSSWRRLRSRLSVSRHLLSPPGAERTLETFPVDP